MTLKAALIVLTLIVVLGYAIVWISKNGGWKSEEGCHGDCDACHARCEEHENLSELRAEQARQAEAQFQAHMEGKE